jgi:photosystem II stability/assembly factor-like uncharacterized protein
MLSPLLSQLNTCQWGGNVASINQYLVKIQFTMPYFRRLLAIFCLLPWWSVNALEPTLSWTSWQLPNKASLRASAAIEQSLWVAGSDNTVYVSFNQGKDWQDVSPNLAKQYDFRDIELLNEHTAILMSAGSGDQSALFITKDTGKSWQLLYQNSEPQGFFDSIAFWNEQQGVLLGDPINGHFVIELTEDQGRTWQAIAPNSLPEMLADEAAFAASGNTLITGHLGQILFATGGKSAQVYNSTDFGQHWQRSKVPLHHVSATSGAYALAFNAKQQLFVLGGDYQQRDGQYSNLAAMINDQWQTVDNGQHGLRTAMACVQATCISTGKLSTDISYDHGVSWRTVATLGFYTLASNQQQIVAAGADGSVAVWSLVPHSHGE